MENQWKTKRKSIENQKKINRTSMEKMENQWNINEKSMEHQ